MAKKKQVFDPRYVEKIDPLPSTEIWSPGQAGEEERAAFAAVLQEFADAGSLVPAMFPQPGKTAHFDLGRRYRYGDINLNELLSDTQVLIINEMREKAPKLYETLRDLGDGKIFERAAVFDQVPIGDVGHVGTPKSIFLSDNKRRGVPADYFTAAASLVMGTSVGRPRMINFFDVVDKSGSGGRGPHTDAPEQFFVLQCQRGDDKGNPPLTLLHNMQNAFYQLEPDEQKLLMQPVFGGRTPNSNFAAVTISDDKGFSINTARSLTYQTRAVGEDAEAANKAFLKWIKRGTATSNTFSVELSPGRTLVVDARSTMHSVARLKGNTYEVEGALKETAPEGTDLQMGTRWLVRSGIYSDYTMPEIGEGSFYRMPKDIDKEATLEKIRVVTQALEKHYPRGP